MTLEAHPVWIHGTRWGPPFFRNRERKVGEHRFNNYLVGALNPSEKYESQLGWLFPIYGKIKNVPNHQPAMVDDKQSTINYSFHGVNLNQRTTYLATTGRPKHCRSCIHHLYPIASWYPMNSNPSSFPLMRVDEKLLPVVPHNLPTWCIISLTTICGVE